MLTMLIDLILDQASEEKKRLEEKQRAARKNRSKSEEDWKTRCVQCWGWAQRSGRQGCGTLGSGSNTGLRENLFPVAVKPASQRTVYATKKNDYRKMKVKIFPHDTPHVVNPTPFLLKRESKIQNLCIWVCTYIQNYLLLYGRKLEEIIHQWYLDSGFIFLNMRFSMRWK